MNNSSKTNDEEQQLVAMFKERQGGYVSGEEISRLFGVSRTAVWKKISKLRTKGFEFEAVSRKGYRLVGSPDALTSHEVKASTNAAVMGQQVIVLPVAESTQLEIRSLAEQDAPEGTLVIAEEQTQGRGRMGRSWYSPAGKGLWMSLLLRPSLPISTAPQLTLLTAVAVCRAIRSVAGVDAAIKWPNDILIKGKKVCGILLESVGEDGLIRFAVAGIGIDVNLLADELPSELSEIMTSLRIERGCEPVDRAVLAGAILTELEQLYNIFLEEGFNRIAALWEALSFTLNRKVTVQTPEGQCRGTAEALDRSGALILLTETGERMRIFSGDVAIEG